MCDKIYMFWPGRIILIIIFITLMLAGAIAFLILQEYIAFGLFIFSMILAMMMFMLQPFWGLINEEQIIIKNFFGKIKKQERWSDLKFIYRIELWGGRTSFDGFVLNFTEKDEEFKDYPDADQTDHIILIEYTPKHEAILKKYTDIPITDRRKNLPKK